jgi:dihydropteroate synthase
MRLADPAGSPTPAPTRIGPTIFRWGERTFVMGILNVTPDSFSGDGLLDPAADGRAVIDAAVAVAQGMVEDGADLLDIGGESTRPGHASVDVAEELARVVPVVAAVRSALPGVPISIDTTKAVVAEAAVEAGADLLNDVWGTDPASPLAAIAAERGLPLVVMHNRAQASYDRVMPEVMADLEAAVERALAAGVASDGLIVDPGFGFGKSPEHNLEVLRDLADLRTLGRPVLLGTSRKSTLGRILDLPVEERLEATLATTALGVAAGVDIVRVHDVRANVRAARTADAIVRGTWRSSDAGGGPP